MQRKELATNMWFAVGSLNFACNSQLQSTRPPRPVLKSLVISFELSNEALMGKAEKGGPTSSVSEVPEVSRGILR
jgi:hypothetical protein